jgi:hypothetical protein
MPPRQQGMPNGKGGLSAWPLLFFEWKPGYKSYLMASGFGIFAGKGIRSAGCDPMI